MDGIRLMTELYVNHVELIGSVLRVCSVTNDSLLSSKIPLTTGLLISDSF